MSILLFASCCPHQGKIGVRCCSHLAIAGFLFVSGFLVASVVRADESVDVSRTEYASIYGVNGRRIEVSDTRTHQSVADGLVRDTPKPSAFALPLPVAKAMREQAIDPSSPVTLALAGIVIASLVTAGWVISRRRA